MNMALAYLAAALAGYLTTYVVRRYPEKKRRRYAAPTLIVWYYRFMCTTCKDKWDLSELAAKATTQAHQANCPAAEFLYLSSYQREREIG